MEQKKTIVSIVVPVYNTLAYLPVCLGSLKNQTIGADRLEIIIVDDGSTDGSVEYLKEFEEQNKNVKLICLPQNTGAPGYVRNVGIKAATGDWLYCVDSDDWLGPEAIKRLVECAEEWDSDVIQGKMITVDGPNHKGRGTYFRSAEASIVNGNLRTDRCLIETVGPMRLIKMDLLKKYNILFTENLWPEDIIFMLEVLFSAKRVSIVNDYNYYFVRRDAFRHSGHSNMDTITPVKKPDRILKAMQTIFDIIDNNSNFTLEYLSIIQKLFSFHLGRAFTQINAYAEHFPEQYPDNGIVLKEQLWERVRRYYAPELRALLTVSKAIRWDYAQHGFYDESEISILPFCTPKAAHAMKLRPDVEGSNRKVARLPELAVLTEDTWQRLHSIAIKAAIFCITGVSCDENLKVLVKGTYEYPLLITEEPEICPVLQYDDQLIFAEMTTVKNDVWGEPYQGRGRWEAVFSIKEWIKDEKRVFKIGVCYHYDENQAAVINTFRDDRFAESELSVTLAEKDNENTHCEAVLKLGNLIERASADEQLKKAKKEIKQYRIQEKELKRELNESKRDLNESKRDLNKAKRDLNKAKRDLNKLMNSKSWKLTKPLRMVGEGIRKILH